MSAMANESFKEEREMREEHHSGPGKYILVWAALMVFTVITVWTGRMHIETGALALALVIASVKGALVALYFMHLSEHQGASRLVFGTSMLFVVLMLLFTLFDIGTRFRPALPSSASPQEWPVSTPGQSGRYGGGLKAPGTNPK
ncbi:cytochrome C oxidase subunit IV family protein [Archangium lansingense]|uniref:Cytochrome C oxidase subunit IV family protein n=1 Tax=Archangium lansingense TaxID=2995310 RepID=A0ABT4AL64_9BACT|nr:cytochrome C oxidase subunit IV family protein [Archangium lansinium]MCY1081594.1 cytochrome C oxidase subunit IV family protein [Archangium lansinium]